MRKTNKKFNNLDQVKTINKIKYNYIKNIFKILIIPKDRQNKEIVDDLKKISDIETKVDKVS